MNKWSALHVEGNVRMVVAGVVIGGDQLHLGVEVILFHERILQICCCFLQGLERVRLALPDGGIVQTSHEGMRHFLQVSRVLRIGAFQRDGTEFRLASKRDVERDICQPVNSVGLKMRSHFGLKVTFALKKTFDRLHCIGDVDRCVWSSGRILGDLEQARIGESALRARKGVHAKVDGGLEHKEDSHSSGIGPELNLHVLKTSGTFEFRDGLVNLGLRERFLFLLHEERKQPAHVDVGLTSEFN